MKINTLVSTIGKNEAEILEIVKSSRLKFPIIINQLQNIDEIKDLGYGVTLINSRDVGLSKSRNLAVNSSNADICIIADDDVIYDLNYINNIENAYLENPDCDVICFYVNRNNQCLNKKIGKQKKINNINLMEIISVQITFKRQSIVNKNIIFNEKFGSGSNKYISGEENLFLKSCLDNKLKIKYLPINIAMLPKSESTWFTGYDKNYFNTKGALFYLLHNNFGYLTCIAFIILKYGEYKKEISAFSAFNYMMGGINEIKKLY